MSPRILNITIVCAAVMLSLLLCETGIRIYSSIYQSKEIAILEGKRPVPGKKYAATLSDILKVSSVREIVYELRPDLNTNFLENRLKTNVHGFRSPAVDPVRKAKTFRILGLGDSVMFGWGVPARATFLNRTRALLAKKFRGCSIEVINTAVPGYNGVMEAATLREKGVQFEPDVVVLGVVQNDLDLPNFLQEKEDYFSLNKLFLPDFVSGRIDKVTLIDSPMKSNGDGFVRDPTLVPAAYRRLVGVENYRRALLEMRTISHEINSGFLVINHGRLSKDLRPVFAAIDQEVLEVAPTWQRYARENNLVEPAAAAQLDPGRDPHPSPLLHSVMAELLSNAIQKEQILSKKLQQCAAL